MKIKIPDKVKIIGKFFDIKYEDKLIHHDDNVGQTRYRTSEIVLQKSSDTWPIKQQDIDQTFLHEITHAILNVMDYPKLRSDEHFVELFSEILYQVLVDNDLTE